MAKLGPSTNGSYGNRSGWEAVGYDGSLEGHVVTVTYPEYIKQYRTEGEIKMLFYARVSEIPESYGTFHGN